MARPAGSVAIRSLHVDAELRRDDQVVRAAASASPRSARVAGSVHVGGVEERDARIERRPRNGPGTPRQSSLRPKLLQPSPTRETLRFERPRVTGPSRDRMQAASGGVTGTGIVRARTTAPRLTRLTLTLELGPLGHNGAVNVLFRNRADAGRQLAEELGAHACRWHGCRGPRARRGARRGRGRTSTLTPTRRPRGAQSWSPAPAGVWTRWCDPEPGRRLHPLERRTHR